MSSNETVPQKAQPTQEVLVDCRNMDEETTEEELRNALKKQFETGEIAQTAPIRLWKTYSGMQVATIKIPTEMTNKDGQSEGWVDSMLSSLRTRCLRARRAMQ